MNKTLPVLLCFSLSLSLTACGTTTEEPLLDQTVTVETTSAQVGDLSTTSTYIGTISAEGTASVIPLVSGTVEEIAVSVGDTVHAGDLLCRFDSESARISLSNAQAAYQSALTGVSSAEAAVSSAQESYQSALAGYGGTEDGNLTVLEEQVRLAQDNYEDTQALFDLGAASQVEVDQAYQALLSARAGLESAQAGLGAAQAGVQQAQAAVESAQAGVQQARAGIASAEYQLSLYNLTTPISGVVEAVNVTENNFSPSGTAAFVISNGNNKTVTFYVTDQVRKNLTLGQEVTVEYNGNTYTGAITEISGVVDAAVGQFQVEAVINGAQDLPDGLSVELATTAYQTKEAILIPSDAMFFENGTAYVYTVRNGKATRTDVTIGLYTADEIAIVDGLAPGAEVITTWSANLRDGVDVRLVSEAEKAEDSAQESPAGSETAAPHGAEG